MIADKLIAAATPIVQHWFTDVTEHDVPLVNDMQLGEFRMWSLRTTGTWLCRLAEGIDHQKVDKMLATILVENPSLRDNSKTVYLIHKTSDNDCDIIPTTYEELSYLVY